ncbi:MAG: DUF808 domain-containing protein [Pirellulaceae bacterium]|nr:DUF808 domain-containing protein [Pirellulaceae bacterium]
MAGGLLMLLDDIASVLDDVATLTKVAAKKTAGILGDDLALNAQQVTGVQSNRELPVVWAVAKGSLVNKAILVPAALLFSAIAAWAIRPLMMVGGAYLCFEGCEKLVHKFLHPEEDAKHRQEHQTHLASPEIDIAAAERTKVFGAVRTDFILSAEIIVITLGTVAGSPWMTQLIVLVSVGLLMTVCVYGLVAAIVKLDDLGLRLTSTPSERRFSGLRIRAGRAIVSASPYLMKLLSIAGTAAMFLVGGGILAHEISFLHHVLEGLKLGQDGTGFLGGVLGWTIEAAAHAVIGVLIGLAVLLVVNAVKKCMSAARAESSSVAGDRLSG